MSYLKNHVMLEDGIIYYTQAGKQGGEIAQNTLSVIRFLAGSLPEVKLLVDYSASGRMDEEAIQQGYHALQVLPIDKAAIVGASPDMIKLVTAMAAAVEKNDIIYFADSREAAVAWLKQEPPPNPKRTKVVG